MAAKSRRKGHTYERLVAIRFRPLFPEARRGLSQTRTGTEVADVDGLPFWLECKHRKRVNVRGALEEATSDAREAGSSKVPLAVCRDNGKPDIVAMHLDDFLELLASLRSATQCTSSQTNDNALSK